MALLKLPIPHRIISYPYSSRSIYDTLKTTNHKEKARIPDSQEIESEFERILRTEYTEGNIHMNTLKILLEAHRKEMEGRHES